MHAGKMKAKPEALAGRLRARSKTASSPEEVVIVAEAAPELSYSSMAVPAHHPANDYGVSMSDSSGPSEAKSSSCGDREGRVSDMARPLPGAEGPPELLHELSNLMTTVLLNAQMLEWKLPPYSHLKRPVHEVARNAQRATELMRRLQQRCAQAGSLLQDQDASSSATASQSAQWPSSQSRSLGTALESGDARTPGHRCDLTSECDPRTSDLFPKKE